MITKGLQSINWWKIPWGCVGPCCCSSGVDPRGFYPFCSDFRMRVSASPFFGACQWWSGAAARQHDRTNRDHVLAADSFPDLGPVERIIEAVAPC
jgi:hypothetical protein